MPGYRIRRFLRKVFCIPVFTPDYEGYEKYYNARINPDTGTYRDDRSEEQMQEWAEKEERLRRCQWFDEHPIKPLEPKLSRMDREGYELYYQARLNPVTGSYRDVRRPSQSRDWAAMTEKNLVAFSAEDYGRSLNNLRR